MIPTLQEVLQAYPVIAGIECTKTGRPSRETTCGILRSARRICRAGHINPCERLDAITRPRLDAALLALAKSGAGRLTVKCHLERLHALFARWCLPYYEDAGWEIPVLKMPVIRALPPRYKRPSSALLTKVKAWYAGLKGEWWFAATMMLEFAMRNGDILRLKEENFVELPNAGRTGCAAHYLVYTPHKTELSSGRNVCWRIHDAIWRMFEDYGRLAGLDVTTETFAELNRQLRALGFVGSKAAYELRKICIDHVYQKYGAEVAVAISGDDIRTISRYYADTSQASGETVLIVDML